MNCIWEVVGGSMKDNCLTKPDSAMGSFIKMGLVKEKKQEMMFGLRLVDFEQTFIYPYTDTDETIRGDV